MLAAGGWEANLLASQLEAIAPLSLAPMKTVSLVVRLDALG